MLAFDPHASTILGVSLTQLGIAFLAILVGMSLSKIASVMLSRLCARAADQQGLRVSLLRAAEKPTGWLFVILSLFFAISVFPLPTEPVDFQHLVEVVFLAGSIVLAIWFGTNLIDGICGLWMEKAKQTESPFDDQLVPIVRKSGKVFLVVAGGVMIIQNLGYSVSSLLAGLGIGGAALALASKDTIANLFGSIVIFLDRPFYVGDWIEIGNQEGIVEEVGLRVTRVRTFANSLITIPNSQLTTMTINNWSRMRKRRIYFTLRLTFDTTASQMSATVEAIRALIRNDSRFHHDFFLVNFNEIGPHSLDIMVYCFTRTTVWVEHMGVRQDFLLALMVELEKLGVRLALPAQTVHMATPEPWLPQDSAMAMGR